MKKSFIKCRNSCAPALLRAHSKVRLREFFAGLMTINVANARELDAIQIHATSAWQRFNQQP